MESTEGCVATIRYFEVETIKGRAFTMRDTANFAERIDLFNHRLK